MAELGLDGTGDYGLLDLFPLVQMFFRHVHGEEREEKTAGFE